MRQYPIWVKILNHIYKSDKSYGVKDYSKQTVYVGTSKANSRHFVDIELRRFEEKYLTKFILFIDGKIMKEMIMDNKSKKMIQKNKFYKEI